MTSDQSVPHNPAYQEDRHPYHSWVDENDVGNTCCLSPRGDPIHDVPVYRLDLNSEDLNWLEFAIAEYIARWGANWTGRPYDGSTDGLPCAVANMAMTVIRKRMVPINDR
jgi:hypothetical protein